MATTQGGNTGTTTIRLSSIRDGFSIDSSTGVITVSDALPIGTYSTTVSATDANDALGLASVTINVIADSSETDSALSFDGSSQWVENVGSFGTSGDFTYELWVKPNNNCSQNLGHNKVLSTANLYISCQGGNWFFSYTKADNSTPILEMSQKVVANEWAHLAVVRTNSGSTGETYFYYNNKQISFYVNGWVSSIPVTSFKGDFTSLKLGGTGTANQYFNGVVDEVKVWQRSRTLADIWAGAHSQQSLYEDLLILMYDFNEASGNAISRSQRGDYQITLNTVPRTSVASTSADGPYTVVKVPRTLINSIGGWRAPDSVTTITALVLGGGGGGGGGYQGGGGGAGGFLENTLTIDPKSVYPIRVGVGGLGTTNPVAPTSGDTSSAFGYTAIGGGAGGFEMFVGGTYTTFSHTPGGSGGGGGWGSGTTGSSGTAGQGFAGGTSLLQEYPVCNPSQYAAAGGGGAGGIGSAPPCGAGGNGGAPKFSNVIGAYLAGGGGGSLRSASTSANIGYGSNNVVNNGGNSGYTSGARVGATGGATHGSPGTGTGGGAGMSSDGTTGYGSSGGSGTVAFRWITAQKPTFTQPKNAFLNAGMTETFSVNVASDSETARLTRTFRWESSTTGETGTYTTIKQGTGAANASFSWVPSDTSTSGNKYVYRVIVTDSDTAGLFIVDTSTAVYATINRALVLSSKSTLTKTVNVAKTETFTVSLGTPTYSYKLEPTSPFFWLDTSTVGSPRIKFADTATVGTYYETFTVTDSVTASIVVPLTIIVSPPPSFSASAAQVDSATVLYLDAGNRASYPGSGTTWSDISGRGLTATFPPVTMPLQNGTTSITCTSPAFSDSNLGSLLFNGTSTCGYIPNVGIQKVYTYEVWVKRSGSTMGEYASIIATPWAGGSGQIAMTLHWRNGTKLQAGVWDGAYWDETSMITVADQTWTHVAITFSGTSLSLIVNGDTANKATVGVTITWNDSLNDTGVLIGKRFSEAGYYFNGSLASVRGYNRVLSDLEIQQNYNATKGRFLLTQNKQSQIGKYGTTVNDTYTVTAGSETITATFTSNAIAGLKWDTSTARSIKLQLQDSLSAGTYNDTITVTDIYGASTRLPLTITISKADTLTVYVETPTALNYTGSPGNFTPVVRVNGLVSSDTGTALSTVRYKPSGATCATGGVCAIGDIGPGGGVVFITPSTTGGNGKYFEAAPANWIGLDDTYSTAKYCSSDSINTGATNVGIGWGETNTAYAKTQCLGGAVAKVNTFNGSNSTGYSDWFIPSTNELIELAKVRDQVGLAKLGSAWTVGRYGYWSSTESSASVQSSLVTSSWNIGGTNKSDTGNNMVRPVRQFVPCWGVDSCTSLSSTTKPTFAGGYVITPSGLSITTGSLSNYETVTYTSTSVTINRIAQSSQAIPFYSPSFPETMTLYTGGGSGTGAQLFTVVSSGGSNTCTFDYRKLTTSAAGSCTVRVVKLGDRNYLPDTATATILVAAFVINQPAPVVGSGPNIGLNGITSITRDPNAAPTISSVVTQVSCLGNSCTTSWSIYGAGFGSAYNTSTIVKFWRNKVVTLGGANSDNYIYNDGLIVIGLPPVGASTGKILVTTANGIAVSPQNWIAP